MLLLSTGTCDECCCCLQGHVMSVAVYREIVMSVAAVYREIVMSVAAVYREM